MYDYEERMLNIKHNAIISDLMLEYNKQFVKKGKSKFYLYRQNNSGGQFDLSDGVRVYTVIEAYSEDHANSLSSNFGIYFDGCSSGSDCECCGDRWYDSPTEYDNWEDITYYSRNLLFYFYYEIRNNESLGIMETNRWSDIEYKSIIIHFLDGSSLEI